MVTEQNALCLEVGVQLEEYRIDGVLGKGGFAITYSGEDQRLQKRVAIKELLPDGIATRVDGNTVMAQTESLRDDYEWAIDSFIKEARTIAGFEHPNIVRVLRFFRQNGTAYMVMPFIEGEDLRHVMRKRGSYAYQDLVPILLPLLDGLRVVHLAGVLHRDIKPENIYITQHGTPILIDFGAARQQVGGKSLDVTSIITPGYAPIEQYSTDAKYQGAWSDIYSMAACVYHMITGKKPAPASERNDAFRNQQPDPLVPLCQLQPAGFPPAFLSGIDQALQMGEAQRPQSVDAWLSMLALSDSPSHIHTSRPTAIPPMPQPASSGGSKKLVFLAVAMLLLAMTVAGGTFWYLNRDGGLAQGEKEADKGSKGETVKKEQPVFDDGQDQLTDLEVAIKLGEYDQAEKMIRGLDRKNLPHQQRLKLADLRELREREMRSCPAMVMFQSTPSSVTVYVDGEKLSPKGGRYALKGVGRHSLRITSPGRESEERVVTVKSKGQVIDLGVIRLSEDDATRQARINKDKADADQMRRDQEARDRQIARQREADAKKQAELEENNREANLKKELVSFVNDYYRRLSSNDVNVVVGLYDNYVNFEYIKGRKASKREVMQSFSANMKRWPNRSYKSHGKTSYESLNPSNTRVKLYFGYDYSYSNYSGKRAKGKAYDTVTIEKKSGDWKITSWEQGVKRTRNDLKGL
ncbi:protein kinase [Verrucomicrobiaceae bacterium N1E253]|uniref:non-specific serine/threonine protein kinase n=1 Tax=Oceaniferula marina TaxID=2748318 RepID=A0A851GIT3_9BACT|nr:protein kinase [Oceaniferula marina]NWK57089.1 protein kinase [Oceaniferula marina]